MLALLIDWGYRADGIPVRLFDAWTTLPAGPATLAAKTGSRILPITIHRNPDDRTFSIAWADPIEVTSSRSGRPPGATQPMADAFAATVAAGPEQWYSFKPVWPSDPAEGDAARSGAPPRCWRTGRCARSAASGVGTVTPPGTGRPRGTLGQRIRARLVAAAARLLLVLPRPR